MARLTPVLPVATAPHAWDDVAQHPDGPALIDAHLEVQAALSELISLVQLLATGKGTSLTAVHARAEALIPLLDGPGRAWTARYWAMRTAVHSIRTDVQTHVDLRQREKYHDFPLDNALAKLNRLEGDL